MIDALVYLLLFSLVFMLLYRDTEERFIALFLGTVLFPSCVWFMDSPKVSPQHLLLYGFFCAEIANHYGDVKRAILKFPLFIPLFIVIVSFVCTVVSNEGFKIKNFYDLTRNVIELYGYLVAAYIIGLRISVKTTLEKLFWPLMILGFLGIVEGLFNANYPYKYICSAFPNYDGFYPLNTSINASDGWRTRTLLTTTYPTAYGTLLTVIVLSTFPMLKHLDLKKNYKIAFVLVFLANLYFCGNRTGILCTGIGLVFWLTKKWPLFIKLVMIILLSMAASLYAYKAVEYFSRETRGSSIQLRQQQLAFSYMQVVNKPIFGNGASYLTKHIFERDTYGNRVEDDEIKGMESILFPKLINYGFFGLGAYFLLCVWIFFYLYKRREHCPEAQCGYLLIFSGTSFFVLSGDMGGASAFMYLMLGLFVGSVKSVDEAKKEEEHTKELEAMASK